MPNIPAKLFDHEALTLRAEVQTALAGIFINIVCWLRDASEGNGKGR
jgi:hypothetical protein